MCSMCVKSLLPDTVTVTRLIEKYFTLFLFFVVTDVVVMCVFFSDYL